MNEIIALLIFVTFLILAVLMATNRLSALLALPIMAVAIAFIGAIPSDDLITKILQEGPLKLNNAIITTMIGGILAQIMNKFKIAHTIVQWAAEFAGDNPFIIGIILTAITGILFSTMGGLGAVIMVGTVVLPVMMSQGLSTLTSAGLFLMGISLGGLFNLSNWTFYQQTFFPTKTPQEFISEMMGFIMPFSSVFAIIIIIFLLFNLSKNNQKRAFSWLIFFVILIGIANVFTNILSAIKIEFTSPAWVPNTILIGLGLLMLISWIYQIKTQPRGVPIYALITPFIPLVLVLGFKCPIIPAFLMGILHGLFSTWQKGHLNKFTQAIFEGASNIVPVLILMMGIGMLINAVSHPVISKLIQPYIIAIIPQNIILYVIVFTILAPLTLYRGPLNLFGMGSGIAILMLNSKILFGGAIMGMLLSVGQLQGVCDPTNTHNIWVANYLSTNTTKILIKTMPYIWIMAVIGLIIAGARYI